MMKWKEMAKNNENNEENMKKMKKIIRSKWKIINEEW